MSLLDESMESCTLYDKTSGNDDFGDIVDTYVPGAKFKAVITLDTSMLARQAQQQGVKNVYTVVVNKNINLNFPDVFKRESDGRFFRVTSDGRDKKTPESSDLNIRAVTAEEFQI